MKHKNSVSASQKTYCFHYKHKTGDVV